MSQHNDQVHVLVTGIYLMFPHSLNQVKGLQIVEH